ncbi:unnamed protein product, partial [marine sediment metagenome]
MERLKQSFNASQQRFKDLMAQAESQKGIEAFDEALDKLQEAMNELERFSVSKFCWSFFITLLTLSFQFLQNILCSFWKIYKHLII